MNNDKLQELGLDENAFDLSIVEGVFSKVLCNPSSIGSIYSSNHTLKWLGRGACSHLKYLLKLNENEHKRHVAIKKISKFHPNIDMEQLFEFGTEDKSLNALPHVVDWLEKARVAVADEEEYNISQQKLSAIYQFACFMPLLFIPSSVPTLIHRNTRDQLDADMNKLKIENGVLRQQIEKLEKEIAMKDAKISSMTTKDKEKLDDELNANKEQTKENKKQKR